MDALQYVQLLSALTRILAAPVLAQIIPFTSRSWAIGYILLLLLVTSITEIFLLGLFRLIRIILIIALACLFGTAVLSWLLRNGTSEGAQHNMEKA